MYRKRIRSTINRLAIITFLFLISTQAISQIYIPIPIFYNLEPKYNCKPQSEKAKDYYEKSLEFDERSIYSSIELLKGSIKEDSLFCDAYYRLIDKYFKVKDYENAYVYTNLALKINELDISLIGAKGVLIYKLGQYQRSLEYFNQLIGKQPRNYLWYYYSAESLINLNLLDSAKKVTMQLETIIHQGYNPEYKTLSHFLQGKIFYLKGEYDTAKKAFEFCKKKYRKRADFFYYYGMTFYKLGDHKKAKKYLKKAVITGYVLSDEEKKLIESGFI